MRIKTTERHGAAKEGREREKRGRKEREMGKEKGGDDYEESIEAPGPQAQNTFFCQ